MKIDSIKALKKSFQEQEITPLDILDKHLQQIKKVNPIINAFSVVLEDQAYQAAEASTKRWQTGTQLSEFDGIPVTIKDSLNMVGTPWRHGSKGHDYLPNANQDSAPTARLKEAGAIILGKTTMPDFGMMASGVSSLYGIVRNPWNISRNTGGSSAGAGASLAAGISCAAVGTDIAGSVRLPAGHCGLVALKPTQGRVPHFPASVMRSAGPMARNMDDLIELYKIIVKSDPKDIWSLPPTNDIQVSDLSMDDIKTLRVGVLLDMGYGFQPTKEVINAVENAVETLKQAGAHIEYLPAVFDDDPYPALDRLFQVRAYSELKKIPTERQSLVLPAVSNWAMAAKEYSATQFAQDTDHVMVAQEIIRNKLSHYDIVISPIIPVVGFAAEEVGLDPKYPLAHCSFTAWFNQTTQPAATLPYGMSDGCPIGVQIIGQRFQDILVMQVTKWLEVQRKFTMNWPTDIVISQ